MSSPGQDYSDDDLLSALRAADAAGDTAGASRLAQIIQGRQQGQTPAETQVAAQQDTNPISRQAKIIGGNLLSGIEQFVGLPGTVSNALTSGANWLLGTTPEQAAAISKGMRNIITPLPSGADIVGVSDKLGLTNNPTAVPQNTAERLEAGALNGIGGVVLPALLSGGATLPSTLFAGAASGAAAEGAHELWPNSSLAPVAAGMATGFGIGGIANAMENSLTGKRLAQGVTDASARLSAAEAAKEGVPDAAAQIGQGIHPAGSLEEAGTHLQNQARAWSVGDPQNGVKSILQTKLDAAWNPVTQLVGADAPVGFSNLEKAINDITTSAGKMEPMAKILRPKAPEQLQDALGKIKDFIGMGGASPPTWSEMAQLRTILGDARGNPQIVESIGQQNLSNLYRGLTADMRAAAKAKSPEALKAYDAANTESSRLYGIAKDQMQPILDKNPEDAAAALISSAKRGGTDLRTLRGEIPSAVDALGAAHLKNLQSSKDWTNLSDEGKLALTGNQSHVDAVDDAVKAGGGVKSAKQSLAAAKQAVADRSKSLAQPSALEGLFGSGIGYDLGVLGLNALGMQGHDILGGAVGSLIGATAGRTIIPVLRGYTGSPSSLRYPLTGALAGVAQKNQLTDGSAVNLLGK